MSDEEYIKGYSKGVMEGIKHARMSPETKIAIEKIKHAIWFFVGTVFGLLADSIIHHIFRI